MKERVIAKMIKLNEIPDDFLKNYQPTGITFKIRKKNSVMDGEYYTHLKKEGYSVKGLMKAVLEYLQKTSDLVNPMDTWNSEKGSFEIETISPVDEIIKEYKDVEEPTLAQLKVLVKQCGYYDVRIEAEPL